MSYEDHNCVLYIQADRLTGPYGNSLHPYLQLEWTPQEHYRKNSTQNVGIERTLMECGKKPHLETWSQDS